MKRIVILLLAASCCALAQGPGDVFFSPMQMGVIGVGALGAPPAPVKGAPYSATITNESVQTLADGTQITQSSSGTTARDSQGRTRQDAPFPALGNLAASDAPHVVFIQDPVAGVHYTLNLTEKTAWKSPMLLPPPPPGAGRTSASVVSTDTVTTSTVTVRALNGVPGDVPPLPPGPPGGPIFIQKRIAAADNAEVTTDDLGTQTIEGVQCTGVRTTQTIAIGKIGNDRPINIVTEVWTSPELKTIVLSKRNDPRAGEQTFKLTNIQRSEPDPSLFTIPADFKLTDNGPETVIYRTKQ